MPFGWPGAVSTDEMKSYTRSSLSVEIRPHKREIAGWDPASASNFGWVAQSVERRPVDWGFCKKPCVDE